MQLLHSLLNFFISNAYADTAAAQPPQQGGFSFVILMAIMIFFMYFALWRPQSKRAKEQRNMLSSLAKGDEVVTAGGILGTIVRMTDSYIILSLKDNVEITVLKSSVVNALPKGTLKNI